MVDLHRCLIAQNGGAGLRVDDAHAVPGSPIEIDILCSDVTGNAAGDYIGIDDPSGAAGNISVDPMFCAPEETDFSINACSPCAPAFSDCDLLIGAIGVNCTSEYTVTVQDPGIPDHVVSHNPTISWTYDCSTLLQEEYEIEVGDDADWTVAELWNPGSAAGTATEVVYDGDPLEDGATYWLRLRIHGATITTDWIETSFRMNSQPTTPLPLSPTAGEISSSVVQLWLQNSTDAEADTLTYEFQLFGDLEMTDLTHAAAEVTEQTDSTGYQYDAVGEENQALWWRGRAFDGFEPSLWTPLTLFYIDDQSQPPGTPLCIGPLITADSIVFDTLPVFKWRPASDPDPLDQVSYNMELARDPDFSDTDTIPGIADTVFQLTGRLLFGEHYWWRVSAIDQSGQTSTSETADFWMWTLGDVSHDHEVAIGDISLLIDHLFVYGTPIVPPRVGDINGNCRITIGDIGLLIDYLFISGTEPEVGCDPPIKVSNSPD
jgi:hypothetical protein